MLVKTAGYRKTSQSESVGCKQLAEVLLNWLKLICSRNVCDSLGIPGWVFCEDDMVKSSAGPKFAMYFIVTPISELSSI
jgi:hypothetical protein